MLLLRVVPEWASGLPRPAARGPDAENIPASEVARRPGRRLDDVVCRSRAGCHLSPLSAPWALRADRWQPLAAGRGSSSESCATCGPTARPRGLAGRVAGHPRARPVAGGEDPTTRLSPELWAPRVVSGFHTRIRPGARVSYHELEWFWIRWLMAQGCGSQGTFQSFGLSSAWPDWPPALGPAWMALVWTYPGPRWLLPHVLRLVFPTGTLSRCPPRRPQDGRDSLPVSRKQIQRFFFLS